MELFDRVGSTLVLEAWTGVDVGVVRLDVVTGGGEEVTLVGAGGGGINLSIFSHSAFMSV